MTPPACGFARPHLVGLAVALSSLLGLPALASAAPSAGSNNASVASGDHGQTVDPGRGATVARFARRMLGVPYVTAGATPGGVDCSGLTMLAYRKVGTRLGHYTGDQWNSGPHRYRVSQLRPGDLVFFFSDHHHVGIYIGARQAHPRAEAGRPRQGRLDAQLVVRRQLLRLRPTAPLAADRAGRRRDGFCVPSPG